MPGDVRCCGSCWVSKGLHDCRTLWGVEFMHAHSSEHWSATWKLEEKAKILHGILLVSWCLPGVAAAAQSKIETTFPCWRAWFWGFRFGPPSELEKIAIFYSIFNQGRSELSIHVLNRQAGKASAALGLAQWRLQGLQLTGVVLKVDESANL